MKSADDTHQPIPPLPRGTAWIALAVVLATLIAYVPALRAPLLLDDWVTLDASSRWESAGGMPTAGRPLAEATLAANYQLNRILGVDQSADPHGRNKAISYRLVNILTHLLTGALLFGVLRRGMRERRIAVEWRKSADPLAAVVVTLWLLHPIQSETINYVVQRTESLASLFYLATLYASQRAWDAGGSRRIYWYGTAMLACLLGMLSKEIVISVPLAVMLYDRAFRLPSWRALLRPGDGRDFFYIALWVVCLATFGVVSFGRRGDATGLSPEVTWYRYLYTQCWSIAHYLRLIAWPNALSPDYGFRMIQGARGIPGAIILSLFGAATIAAWTRVERFGWFAFLGSMFFMLLAPSSSVVPVALEIAAERRVYLALAVVLLLAIVAAEYARRRMASSVDSRWAVGIVATIATALTLTTAARSHAYTVPEQLWRDAVKAVPGNSRALEQLGVTLSGQRPPNTVAAESAFVAALAMDSSCQSGCLQYGALLSNEGRYAAAIPLLEKQSLEDFGTRYNLLATKLLAHDLLDIKQYDRAIPYLERVVQQDPTMSAFVALGVAYLSVGRRDEAVATFRFMATFDPAQTALQQLSKRLEAGVNAPGALSNLQDFALSVVRGWL